PTGPEDFGTPRKILTDFATKAYRRPVRPAEIDRLVVAYKQLRNSGASFEQAVRDCVAAVLTSPNFLYREEAASPVLGDYEVASRLSYFLWGSMPDDQLFKLASEK